jgi:hypothetical protein
MLLNNLLKIACHTRPTLSPIETAVNRDTNAAVSGLAPLSNAAADLPDASVLFAVNDIQDYMPRPLRPIFNGNGSVNSTSVKRESESGECAI